MDPEVPPVEAVQKLLTFFTKTITNAVDKGVRANQKLCNNEVANTLKALTHDLITSERQQRESPQGSTVEQSLAQLNDSVRRIETEVREIRQIRQIQDSIKDTLSKVPNRSAPGDNMENEEWNFSNEDLDLDNFESPAQNKSAFPSEQVEAGHRSSPTSVLDRSKSLPRDSSTSLPENDLELGRRPSRKAKEGKTYHNLYLSREFNKSLNGRIIKNGARKSVGSARVKDPSSSTQKKDDGSTKPLMTSPEIFVTPRKSSPQPQRLNSTKRTRTRTPDSMASEDMISPGPKLKEKKRRRTDSGERKGLLSEFQGVSSGL